MSQFLSGMALAPDEETRLVLRATKEWSALAGEQITVERIGGVLYAFGSELACLRLYRHWRGAAECKYSTNLQTWYFSPA